MKNVKEENDVKVTEIVNLKVSDVSCGDVKSYVVTCDGKYYQLFAGSKVSLIVGDLKVSVSFKF